MMFLCGCYTIPSLKEKMPKGDNLVISPTEGHVLKIINNIKVADCNPLEINCFDKQCSFSELEPYIKDGSSLVIIFMKLYHKHVTVSPIAGEIRQIKHKPGMHRNVFLKDAYKSNEHNSIVIDGDITLTVIQIAGLVARRIVCDVSVGDSVGRGDKIGHIKLGSAVALLLPPECEIKVKEGDKVDTAKGIIATYPIVSE